MFNFEKAIAAWRRSFEHDRVFSPDDLEELERHLRDHTAHLVARGWTQETAFQEALRGVGDYGSTEAEYRKVFWEQIRHRHTIIHEITWRAAMVRSYLTIALRGMQRQKLYTLINLTGLAVGIAVCIVIALFIRHELSYDRFHENVEQIYRLTATKTNPDGTTISTSQPAPMGPALVADFPEIEQAVRFKSWGTFPILFGHEDRRFYETGLVHADANVFKVFSFELLQGDPSTALTKPYTLVLTEDMARKYFGDENPIGKTLSISLYETRDYEVTGIVKDPPSNSSIQFDFLASFATRYQEAHDMMVEQNGGWDMSSFPTYLLLAPGASPKAVLDRIPDFLRTQTDSEWITGASYDLEPLRDIHLYSKTMHPMTPGGDVRYIYIFGTVAVLILLLASINYMNLATARAVRRAREVGVRKSVGATRPQLARQFLGESLLMVFFATAVALALAAILLPLFSQLSDVALAASLLLHPVVLACVLGLTIVLGVLSGSYPALALSHFRPADVLKGSSGGRLHGALFRKGMVVFQFTVSVALLIGATVIRQQLDYVQETRLGFDKEQRLVISTHGRLDIPDAASLKQELLKIPAVQSATVSSAIPSKGHSMYSIRTEEIEAEDNVMMAYYAVDDDFLTTMGIELAAGRALSDDFPSDAKQSILLNEAAVERLGWDNPIGKKITYGGWPERTVVGVVENFHFESLHHEIGPLFMVMPESYVMWVTARIDPANLSRTFTDIETVWNRIAPARPLDAFFLDDAYEQLYQSEQRIAQVFSVFFALAMLIACLGLFGLVSFTAEQRTKEIGIRKVFGATAGNIVTLLSKDFLKLVVVALVIAAPLAYFLMQRWLQDFAYRIEIGPGIFILAGVLALLIAVATVSYQAIKAALTNPVESLRYE